MARQIDRLERRAVTVATDPYAKQTIKWIGELNKFKSYKSKFDISELIEPIRVLYEKAFLLSYLNGADVAKEQIDGQVKKFAESTINEVGFDKAIDILKKKEIITPDEFEAMAADIKAASFSIKRIERLDALIKIHHTLITAINAGQPLEAWRLNLPDIFQAYGITPLSPHHIENVFRTNIQTVYNVAHWDRFQADDNVEGSEHVSVPDDRRRDDHALLDAVYRKDDPRIAAVWPPHDYQCRCGMIAVTIGRREAQGIDYKEISKGQSDLVPEDFRRTKISIDEHKKRLESLIPEKEKELTALRAEVKEKAK